MLKGQAKTDYQREYMRKRRSNKIAGSNKPNVTPLVRPDVQGWSWRSSVRPDDTAVLPQSHNPMMAGYVRTQDEDRRVEGGWG